MIPFPATSLLSTGAVPFILGDDAVADQVNGCQGYLMGMPRGTLSAVDAADERMGAARYAAGGILRLYDATSALPAGAVVVDGVAMSSTGQLCITTDAVTGETMIAGMAVRSDGAVFASDMSPAAWFRFGVGVTAAGGLASAWADGSGNARTISQSTEGNRPAYSAGVLTFDGVDNYMKTASFTLEQPTTVYLVVKQVTWVLNEVICDGDGAAGGAIQQAATTPGLTLNAGTQTAENAGLAVGSFGIVCAVFNGASSSLRVNRGTATTGNANTGDMNGFTLGATGTPSNYGACAVKEAILFPTAHATAQQNFVIDALNDALGVF